MRRVVAVVAVLLALAAVSAAGASAARAPDVSGAPAASAERAAGAGAATRAPVARIDDGPVGRTAERQPLFSFSAAEAGASFACRIVAVGARKPAFHPCAGVDLPAEPLADGDYRFEVRATGAADTAGPIAARAFTVERPLTSPPLPSAACRASVTALRAARRAVITGQRTLARALDAERRARARGDARALKAARRRTAAARTALTRAGKRLTSAQSAVERRCD